MKKIFVAIPIQVLTAECFVVSYITEMGVATFGRPNNLWMWYANQNVDVELVNVQVEEPAPNQTPQGVHRGINYNRNGVNIVLGFQNTRRRFAEPEFLAAVLGSLARYAFSLSVANLQFESVVSHGFSFKDATSYPSASHPNGNAFDTRYLSGLVIQNMFVDAMRLHGIMYHVKSNVTTMWQNRINNAITIGTPSQRNHHDHFHSGGSSGDTYMQHIQIII